MKPSQELLIGTVTMDGCKAPFALTEPLGSWRPLDLLLVTYTLLSLLVLTIGCVRGVPNCGPQILVNAAVLASTLLITRWSRNTVSAVFIVLRIAYVPLLYWVFYHQIEILWPVLHGAPLDAPLARLEETLFGLQPSLAFRAALPYPWLSEIFCFAYFAYYFFTPILGFTVLFRRGYLETERIIFAASLCFFACYTFFWLFPTIGPHFWFPPHKGPQLYDGYIFNHLLFFLTSGGEIRGAAFPSSHVAVALLYSLSARRQAPGLFLPLAMITMLMLPAVVYLRAHYVIDVPLGILTGVIVFLCANRVHDALDRICGASKT